MFSSIVREHRANTARTRAELASLKSAALASAEVVTSHLFSSVSVGVGELYANQRILQTEASILQGHTLRFAKHSQRWLALSASLNSSLLELGDVTNWSLTIQKDVRFIERHLEEAIEQSNERRATLQERKMRAYAQSQERESAAALALLAPADTTPLSGGVVQDADEELP
jgi:hypothetical protein